MHPLDRRIAKLEPRQIRETATTDASQRFFERMENIRKRMSSVVIDEKSLSLAEIMAGAPCGEATKQRLWDYLASIGVSEERVRAIRGSLRHSSELGISGGPVPMDL